MTLSRSVFRVALAASAAVLSACGDIEDLRATEPNITRSLRLYALSSAPPSYPSALNTPFASAVVVDPFGLFDVALDFGPGASEVVVHPVRRVVASISGVNRIGLTKVPGTFESVLKAPTSGFVRDSSLTVVVGDVVVVEAERRRPGDHCSFALSPNVYSKFVVDAINRAAGTIDVRITTDPNCGFRSFEEGVPRN